MKLPVSLRPNYSARFLIDYTRRLLSLDELQPTGLQLIARAFLPKAHPAPTSTGSSPASTGSSRRRLLWYSLEKLGTAYYCSLYKVRTLCSSREFGPSLFSERSTYALVLIQMDPSYLGVPSPKVLRARTPPPLRVLESTGSGASYAALRSSARPTRDYKRHKAPNAPLLERIQRRPKLLLSVIAVCLAAWLVWHLSADYVVLFRFKMRDRAYEERWVKGCGLRKKPLLFVRGTNEVAVVWESNCDREFELRWGLEEVANEGGWMSSRKVQVDKWKQSKVKRVRIPDTSNMHYAYQSVLKNLAPGAIYAYEVSLPTIVDTTLDIKPQDTPATPLASHFFSWAGPSPSPSTSVPTTIHFAALADNQYNVRTFHRILLALLSYGRSLSPSLPKPHLILHAGDQVQNPHNLAQWQTDFWEALTSLLPVSLGQSTPILLARGNHDWDSTGENAYTGGSPPRADWLAHRRRRGREKHVGTYMSYSPHTRCRILVLDSNLDEMEQQEQEEWLEWELGRKEWTSASLRLVTVHVAPFLEYWDTKAWTDGKESQWYVFAHRLHSVP